MIDKKQSSENRRILRIAIPSIISNITVPLLGLIDVTIVGHLGSPAYIGAIAVGGMLFNIIYWIFGFLRMGTSGMTSQAYGQHDLNEITRLLLRSVGVGLFIALCLLILQYPILKLAFTLIQTTPEVEQLATTYFYICIWGAPATLGLYGFAGWFIGMQNSRFPMYIAITQNIVNIVASLSFVYLLDMKVAGVATGTLIAQYAGFFMAILLYMRYYSALRKRIVWKEIIQKQAMYRFFQVPHGYDRGGDPQFSGMCSLRTKPRGGGKQESAHNLCGGGKTERDCGISAEYFYEPCIPRVYQPGYAGY